MTVRTVGVEEEFLLVDPDSGRRGRCRTWRWPRTRTPQLTGELQREQLETATRPCPTLAELGRRAAPGPGRGGAGRAGRPARSWRALATSPLPSSPTLSPSARYREMGRRFGLTVSEELTCGCHVHVADRLGRRGRRRARPDPRRGSPPLLALTANSPFWQGVDSGYASYRSQVWPRWPSAGPYAPFGSPAGYHGTVAGDARHRHRARPRDGLLRRPALGAAPDAGGPGRRRVPGRRRRGAARRAGPGAGRDGGAGVAGGGAGRPGAAGAAAAGGVARGPLGRGRRAARSLHLAPGAGRRGAGPAGQARRPGAGGGGGSRRGAGAARRGARARHGRAGAARRGAIRGRRSRWPCAGRSPDRLSGGARRPRPSAARTAGAPCGPRARSARRRRARARRS